MDAYQCIHCVGTGKEFDSALLSTGEKKYRTCSVCGGSGKVNAERSHYSQYPDVSLRNAEELIRIHGKPVEIGILENEISVLFEDKTVFLLGGFTVGYKGTGPDFTKRFLDTAGFNISKEDIAAMKPPLTLLPGVEFIPTEELVIYASSLDEAEQKARESIPADAKIIALNVINDGQQTKSAIGQGADEELAIQDAMRWFSPGTEIVNKEIKDEFHFDFVEGKGNSREMAFADARTHLPVGVTPSEEKVIHDVAGGIEEVKAFVDRNVKQYAFDQIKSRFPNLRDADIKITNVECIQREHLAGPIAHLLKRTEDTPGIYRVKWTAPIKVSLGYQIFKNKVANLTVKPQPAVGIIFQPTTKRCQCKLCSDVFPVSDGKILIRKRCDESWDSVMFSAYERSGIFIMKQLGVNLGNLSDYRKDVFVCNQCFFDKFLPVAKEDIKKKSSMLVQAIKIKHEHTSEHTGIIEDLGGFAELEINSAYENIINLAQLAPMDSSWRRSLDYWVLNLTEKMIDNKQILIQSIEDSTRDVILAAVESKHKETMNQAYTWDNFIGLITKLFSVGLISKGQVQHFIENKELYAKQFLADGSHKDLWWGISAEVEKKNAQSVIEKLSELDKLLPS